MEIYDQDKITVVGLKGFSQSGKTTLARNLDNKLSSSQAIIDHFAFARALTEIASIKRDTKGVMERDRKLYGIHSLLVKLLGGSPLYGAPSYQDIVDLTQYIVDKEMTPGKPREFMLEIALLIKEYNEECFIEDTYYSILHRRNLLCNEDADDKYIAVISDARYENEAQFIKQFHRNLLIELEVPYDILAQRSLESEDTMSYQDIYNHESTHMNWTVEPDYKINAAYLDEAELFTEVKRILEQESII